MFAVSEPIPAGLLIVFIGVLGLIFGSFVTALSYRLPRGISIAKGRSACPACGATLTVRDLIPVVSWLVNRRSCRACGAKVSWRYPLIELVMSALFVLAVVLVDNPARLIVVLAATPAMVALSVIDIEHRRLPNVLVAYLAVSAAAFRYLLGADFVEAAASAVGVFAAALLLDWVGRRLLRQGLGMGDAKLMAIAALALPPVPLLMALTAAGCLGALTGVIFPDRQTAGRTQVPLGPAILIGFWGALVAL